MKKYLVTELGFIGRLVRPGEIIEVDGDPPIGGLVPVEEDSLEALADNSDANPVEKKSFSPRKKNKSVSAADDSADVI